MKTFWIVLILRKSIKLLSKEKFQQLVKYLDLFRSIQSFDATVSRTCCLRSSATEISSTLLKVFCPERFFLVKRIMFLANTQHIVFHFSVRNV